MAVVPFRAAGPAADQAAERRLLQIGRFTLELCQEPDRSGSSRVARPQQPPLCDAEESPAEGAAAAPLRLQNVGLVVWQSGFLLAELLLRRPPLGEWAGVRVVDVGAGTGVVGIALALAAASVTLADLPHITPLTQRNVELNGVDSRCQVVSHAWGEPLWPLEQPPDIVTGADLLYEPAAYPELLASLEALCGPHTLLFLSFRSRAAEEHGFKALLEGRGFLVRRVDSCDLHEEYRQQQLAGCRQEGAAGPGSYHVLAAQKLG